MSPCSAEGHCYDFPKSLQIPLDPEFKGPREVIASYLEDGRIVAQGQVSLNSLVILSEMLCKELLSVKKCSWKEKI